MGKPTLTGLGSWTEYKGESELSTSIHPSLLPGDRCNGTSSLVLLPCGDGLDSQTVRKKQILPLLNCFCLMFCCRIRQVNRKPPGKAQTIMLCQQ